MTIDEIRLAGIEMADEIEQILLNSRGIEGRASLRRLCGVSVRGFNHTIGGEIYYLPPAGLSVAFSHENVSNPSIAHLSDLNPGFKSTGIWGDKLPYYELGLVYMTSKFPGAMRYRPTPKRKEATDV